MTDINSSLGQELLPKDGLLGTSSLPETEFTLLGIIPQDSGSSALTDLFNQELSPLEQALAKDKAEEKDTNTAFSNTFNGVGFPPLDFLDSPQSTTDNSDSLIAGAEASATTTEGSLFPHQHHGYHPLLWRCCYEQRR